MILLLVAMPRAPSSFLLLVVMPGAPSSVCMIMYHPLLLSVGQSLPHAANPRKNEGVPFTHLTCLQKFQVELEPTLDTFWSWNQTPVPSSRLWTHSTEFLIWSSGTRCRSASVRPRRSPIDVSRPPDIPASPQPETSDRP